MFRESIVHIQSYEGQTYMYPYVGEIERDRDRQGKRETRGVER